MTVRQSGTLSVKERRAVDLMLSGLTQDECARRLEIGRMTLYRWRQRPAFQQALHAAEEDRRLAQLRSVAVGAQLAARYLMSVVGDEKKSVADRRRAAAVLLGRWVQLQPAQLRADVAMSVAGPPVDTTDALADLEEMLGAVRDRRDRTSIEHVRGNGAGNGTNGNGADR